MTFIIQLESFNSYHNPPTSALATLVFLQSCPRTFTQVVSYAWITLSSLLHLRNSTPLSYLRLLIHQVFLACRHTKLPYSKPCIIRASFSAWDLSKLQVNRRATVCWLPLLGICVILEMGTNSPTFSSWGGGFVCPLKMGLGSKNSSWDSWDIHSREVSPWNRAIMLEEPNVHVP